MMKAGVFYDQNISTEQLENAKAKSLLSKSTGFWLLS